MTTLIIAELEKQHLKESVRQLISAANKIEGDKHLLIMGNGLRLASEEAQRLPHISKIILAESEALSTDSAENLAEVVISIAERYSHILAPASVFGKNFLPRVAARLDTIQLSDVMAITDNHHFSRPIYAGSLIADMRVDQKIIPMTLRISAFEAVEGNNHDPVEVEQLTLPTLPNLSQRVNITLHESTRPQLDSAKTVISGGRGLGSQENFHSLLEPLADKLNAAVGASRAAVDLGYAPNDYQVGQTGKIIAPNLYIAVGISGAIQHLAGMKNAKCIVAINKDPDAPIHLVSDYSLVGDLNELIPELTSKL
ncbi:MAG: electron transfer flavoprotein subunit alpha [Ferrovum sp. 37-45-19]|nr:MAG: electron transfer flavoprotein subunit alpha [Ferrovum sp. 21-44-67]OYV95105.1 MAG: electron transfer flavoprotein subunit alpha [Ferrovum sp. 37-45-19]HQT80829.1 electron transfer flavoprotein subunit alpha/FixB family protein [Ferrovaceae bacterium]HQU06569.1 electron transfer flavoprotein subunit alpha/FixB family protein [Ferrovaceae bacterium]